MAETFKNQVDALTGFASTEDDALTDWLTSGAKEIINVLPPKLKEKCATETTLDNSSTTMDVDAVGDILYVTRMSADSGGFRVPCREIPSAYGGLTESSSGHMIYEASATDPVYWIWSSSDASILNVRPTPTANQTAIVYHVGYPTVAHGDGGSGIASFPDEAEYLVVLYAAAKALQYKMNKKSSDLPSYTSPSAPVVPAIETVSYSDYTSNSINVASVLQTTDYPDYTSPTVGDQTEGLTAAMDADSTGVGTDNDFLNYSKWFSVVGELIEDDEDIELAGAQIEKINSYVNSYNVAMQDKLNTFNEAVVKFNSLVQKATTESNYQMQKNIQEAQLLQQQRGQKAVQDLQAAIENNNRKLAKFQQESNLYQANVNEEVKKFTANLQKHTTDYQWLQSQYVQLKSDYRQGLQMLISGGLPQPQQEKRGR